MGWYALLLNLAALQAGGLPRPLALLGVVLGALHLADLLLPEPLRLLAPLASIGWAAWLALALWREEAGAALPAARLRFPSRGGQPPQIREREGRAGQGRGVK